MYVNNMWTVKVHLPYAEDKWMRIFRDFIIIQCIVFHSSSDTFALFCIITELWQN